MGLRYLTLGLGHRKKRMLFGRKNLCQDALKGTETTCQKVRVRVRRGISQGAERQ